MLALSNVSNVQFLLLKTHKMRPGDDMLQVAANRHEKTRFSLSLTRIRVNKKSETLSAVTLK